MHVHYICNKPVKTGVECGIECRMLRTTEERVLKEYQHETHCICKKDKKQKQLEVEERRAKKGHK